MAGVNKVILVGNIGKEPEIRTTQSGSRIAHLSVATSERWYDKAAGETKEKTQWHSVVIFNEALVNVVERVVGKGSKVYVEGQLETRKWTSNDGTEKYATEVVLRPYKGELEVVDGRKQASEDDEYESPQRQADYGNKRQPPAAAKPAAGYGMSFGDLDDEIPF